MERGYYSRGGGSRGGGGGGGRGGRGRRGGGRWVGDQHHPQQYRQQQIQQPYQGGGRGGRGPFSYADTVQSPAQQWGPRPGPSQGGSYWSPTPPAAPPEFAESSSRGGGYGGGGRGAWAERAWRPAAASAPAPAPARMLPESRSDPSTQHIQPVKISEQLPASSSTKTTESKLLPVQRPDGGGTIAILSPRLLVNHFRVMFNPETTIIHYDVDIKHEVPSKSRSGKILKSDIRMIKDKLFSDDPSQFPLSKTAYDGEKNIFSAVPLPTGNFKVELSDGEDTKSNSYIISIKAVNELQFSKLNDYLSGNVLSIPRDVLQGMDLIMKENPSRNRISVGRSFYPTTCMRQDDLDPGITAAKGFQQSLKATLQGLSLCLDYSVLAFHKRLPVLDFLREHLGFANVNDVKRLRNEVINALTELKVTVTHRLTKQKYTIRGLTDENTRHVTFDKEDPEGKAPKQKIRLVDYFRETYNKNIEHLDIPCLDLGKNNKINYVPMEFCVLVEGQRYPKEYLSRRSALFLREMSLAPPKDRMNKICEMVRAEDGPLGGKIAQNFGLQVIKNMTKVVGRVIGPPQLKLGNMNVVSVDREKCQWNLVGKSVVDGKQIERWALLDFSFYDRRNKLNAERFVWNLIKRCQNLGIHMEEPIYHSADMRTFSDIHRLHRTFEDVIAKANRKWQQCRLQIIVCVMANTDPGYKSLKWLAENQIGMVTQCCLSERANKANDQYLANFALKINAKLGGSNTELIEQLPRFEGEGHVMFIGADVNHPAAKNKTSPSIAAVVGTVNWPGANRYAARVSPQFHRKETILNFGAMCLELVQTYARINKAKPQRIVVFRDGVSEGQFEMVLNQELFDLKRTIYEENYRPTITLVVAQKRHQTRLFPESFRDGGSKGNVPPGTVVDRVITHPFEFDFYLCSHFGGLGTSKPTHYHVLWDEHNFTSDQLQKLIYDLCFTFARCTKPVSLVPPVYYADLVAYRGRMFQEVLMQISPASAAASSSTSSSSDSSFDDKFYKLHPELDNVMFFV